MAAQIADTAVIDPRAEIADEVASVAAE